MHSSRLSVPLELKAKAGRKFEGYGSIFQNRDLGGDIVVPGAFAKSIARHKAEGTMPLMFWMHDPASVPGLWLDMDEDRLGLKLEGELVDTTLGRDVNTLLDKKAVRGLSIGYQALDVGWDREGNRLLKQIELHEVSIVSMAMNPLARVEAMKARLSASGEYVPTEREFERLFKDAGCSKAVSRALVARIFDTDAGGMPVPRWDAGAVETEDDEAKAALQGVLRLLDKVGAGSIERP
jgi:uncharacterized protein